MQIWTFLHISFMFASITVSFGLAFFATMAAWRRDVGALRGYVRISSRTLGLEFLLAILGLAFGFVTAIAGNFDLLRGWLVLAYLLVGISIANNLLLAPYTERMKEALTHNEGDTVSTELEAYLGAPWLYLSSLLSALILVTIIWDMVFKPQF